MVRALHIHPMKIKKIKTMKISSYESGGIFAKFCTNKNFPLHGGLVSGLTQFTLKLLHFYGYTGMLSKSRSQALRLAPVMHLLFHFGEEGSLSDNISDAAMKAAINFARVSCEQTAMIIGKGSVEEVIQRCQSGELIVYIQAPPWCKAPPPAIICDCPRQVPMGNTVHVIYINHSKVV